MLYVQNVAAKNIFGLSDLVALSRPGTSDSGMTDVYIERLKHKDWERKHEVFEKIIEIFDRYNFTIHEDDPFDREVAVDPEMLGKIFETMISVSKDNIEDILSLYQKEKDKSHDSDKIISVDI